MKFFNLLKKELAELLNLQTVISLAVTMAMLMFLGSFMSSTIEEAVKQEYTVTLCDRDKTDFTAELIETLRKNNAIVNEVTSDSEDYSQLLRTAGKDSVIVIPQGFTDALNAGKAPGLISVSEMRSAAMMSNMSNNNDGAVRLIRDCISNVFAERAGLTPEDVKLINAPVSLSEFTVVKDKTSEVSAEEVMGNIMMQNMLLPIIVFVLIMMTSQMLMSAISNEKIDKTLETLLSAPVSRTAVLGAKMLAAAIVAMINAVCFMVGFSGMMMSATDSVTSEFEGTAINEYIPIDSALEQLGLTLGGVDYVLVGLQLFLTIMICLSVSLMLGALVNDTKQAQTMVMPLMFAAMIPYMISMFADINSLPIVIRLIVYAIPFTHTFSAIPNLMFGHMGIFFAGLVYQIIAFAFCMFFALRLFKSDKILTVSLNFGQKSKFKKAKKNEN